MNPRLFVYGTLLSTAGHPMAARLHREAHLIGPAAIQGRLYSLGPYPGLVEKAACGATPAPVHGWVHGELHALKAPAVALKWLDAYEGLVPGRPDLSAYGRVERPVRLASGQTLIAWVYLYRRSIRTRPEVPGGHWMPPPRA